MLSRVANSIYWMSRYIERAENIARFIHVNLNLMLDMPSTAEETQWKPMAEVTGDLATFEQNYGEPTEENVLRFLSSDGQYPNSILSCVRKARENARTIRETISSEMWAQINYFYQYINDAAQNDQPQTDPNEFFTQVKRQSHLFEGIADSTFTHGEGWHFLRLGRMLERADKTSRILDVKYFLLLPRVDYVGAPLDKIQWSAVLKSASGLEMFRKTYHRITPDDVASFLILDRKFPRAILYCLTVAKESLLSITGSPEANFCNAAEQRLGRLTAKFYYMTIEEIMNHGLHEFLDGFQGELNEVSEAIYQTFFAPRQVIAGGRWGGELQ